MEIHIWEEKYNNLRSKYEYDKVMLKKEIETWKKKVENLERSYIEMENRITNICQEKEQLENELEHITKKNTNLQKELEESTTTIQELKDLSKTYKKMIKNRDEELSYSEELQKENTCLKKTVQLVNNEKLQVESELAKKRKTITIIKEKYKKNIGRLMEKFNDKEKQVQEFQNFLINELHSLKKHISSEERAVVRRYDDKNKITDNSCYNIGREFYDEKSNDVFMNISVHLDLLTKKLEEKIYSSRGE